MRTLVVVGMLIGFGGVLALLGYSRRDPAAHRHGWYTVVPLLIIAAWLIEQLIMG